MVSLESATPWIARTSPPGGARIDSIDLLRGLVMVVMALDHTRDFFSAGGFNPRDVGDPALFLTRWVTHFCAPVFVFLAGTSAFLYGARGRTVREVSRFLFTRGLLLVLLEVTVVRFAWTFSLLPEFLVLQVIWAIGVSMIALAGLIHLPRWAIGAFGIGLMAGHNLLDGIQAAQLGSVGGLWHVLHQPALMHPTPEVAVFALYPLIPWIGVTLAAFMSRAAPSLSLSTKRTNSGCVMLIGSPPCLAIHSRRSGPASTRPMSFASLSTTPVGVPAGTHIPYQIGKSNLATLASAIVGTSGSKVERRAVLTPSATSVPSRMWGRAREIGTK